MPTAEELLVAIRSEGVGETRDNLQGVSDQMEETAETAGDSAEELEGFSDRFEGAIGAAVAALAVGAAGLASQVPVLGGLFSGVAAVVSAVAFQMDQVLRPVLTPLTKLLYKASGAIFNMNGAAGDAVGVIGSLITAIGAIGGPIAVIAGKIFGFAAVWGKVVAAIKAVGSAIAAIIGTILSIKGAIVIAIAAIVGFAAAYLTNWNGVRDTTNRIVGDIVSRIQSFVGTVADVLGDLASDGIQFGKDLINGFTDGVEAAAGEAKNAIRGFVSDVRDLLPGSDAETGPLSDLTASGEALPRTFAQGISKNSDASRKATESALTGPQPGTFGGGGGAGELRLDGRKMTEDTGRYRSDASNRRGI